MHRLKIATVPMKIAWADREDNLRNVELLASKVTRDTDILVLPELFSTGFIQDAHVINALAEPINGDTITELKALSRRYGFAVAGSFLCRAGEKFLNRCFFIEPSGEETYYDKRHLFSLSSEHQIFTPGDKLPPVIRFRGWNISIIICYDLRFPVWCRNRSQRYDVMLVPANWPVSRGYAWQQLLIGRAIENQAIYVGANRGGSDDYGDYDGLSVIVNGMGKIVSDIDQDTGIIYADLDRDELAKTREKLPFGSDADDFTLECSAY